MGEAMNYLMLCNWDGNIHWGIYTKQELEDKLNDEEFETKTYDIVSDMSTAGGNPDFEEVINRLNDNDQVPNRTLTILKFEIVSPKVTKYTID